MTYRDNGYVPRVGYHQQFAPAGASETVALLDNLIAHYGWDGSSTTKAEDPSYAAYESTETYTMFPNVLGGPWNITGLINGGWTYPETYPTSWTAEFRLGTGYGGGDVSEFNPTGDWTMALWSKNDVDGSGYNVLFSLTVSTGGNVFFIAFNPNNGLTTYTVYDSVSGSSILQTDFIGGSTWTLYVFEYDSALKQHRLWNSSTGWGSYGTALPNGARADGDRFLIGGNSLYSSTQTYRDEQAFWSRKLNDSEIAALYNSGNGLAFSNWTAST